MYFTPWWMCSLVLILPGITTFHYCLARMDTALTGAANGTAYCMPAQYGSSGNVSNTKAASSQHHAPAASSTLQ
jgi:hypothetical protein